MNKLFGLSLLPLLVCFSIISAAAERNKKMAERKRTASMAVENYAEAMSLRPRSNYNDSCENELRAWRYLKKVTTPEEFFAAQKLAVIKCAMLESNFPNFFLDAYTKANTDFLNAFKEKNNKEKQD